MLSFDYWIQKRSSHKKNSEEIGGENVKVIKQTEHMSKNIEEMIKMKSIKCQSFNLLVWVMKVWNIC